MYFLMWTYVAFIALFCLNESTFCVKFHKFFSDNSVFSVFLFFKEKLFQGLNISSTKSPVFDVS